MQKKAPEISKPLPTEIDFGAYRIAVGLKPSQQELDFNRRADSR